MSLSYDRRLAADDVAGSRAHVRGLAAAGLLSDERGQDPAGRPRPGRRRAGRRGTLVFQPGDEDVHTAVERRVTEIAGDVGRPPPHRPQPQRPGRHRPAPVHQAGAARRRPAGSRISSRSSSSRAQEAEDAYLPGYTHLQRAQPVLLAHHLLAHGWAFARDVDRLVDTRRRLDVSPARRRRPGRLVAARSTPTGWPASSASRRRFENSLDAVSDRDFVAEALFDLALIGIHLSRLGEEMVLWSSEEFGFVDLADAYATGSSMLPAEEEPRHRRAGPGQGRPAHRPPDRAAGHPQGAARWPTTGTSRRTRSRSSTPSTRSTPGPARP